MIDSISSPASTALGDDLNVFTKQATAKEAKNLQKIEDKVSLVDERISTLGSLRTKLDDLNNAIKPFCSGGLGKNCVFKEKKSIVPENIAKYADISVQSDTPEQKIPIELKKIATGEIIKALNFPNTELNKKVSETSGLKGLKGSKELKDLKTITFTVHDNGLKSDDLNSDWKANDSSDFLKPGTLLINGNIDVKIETSDDLPKIAEKINLACNSARVKNPHIVASVEKKDDKIYLLLRSEEKHHGVQNKFTVTGDALKTQDSFTTKNEEIEINVNEDWTLQELLTEMEHSAKRADILLLQEQQQLENTVLFKSLLTGKGNEMKIEFTDNSSKDITPEILPDNKIQKAEDAIIYVNKQIIESKSNVIEAGGLKIKLLSQPKKSEQETFDITVIHDSDALYQQFLQLATAYNEYAKFAAEQRFEIIDSKTGASKPAPNAVLGKEYSTIFNQIDLSLQRMFSRLQDISSYAEKNQMNDIGIVITDKEHNEPPKEINGEKVTYKPVEYGFLAIDEAKLKKACSEKFDEFQKIFADVFSSTNPNFAHWDNKQNVDLGATNIGKISYDVHYDKIKFMQNLSKEVTGLGNGDIYLNGVKISVSSSYNAETLAKKINEVSSTTEIEARLVDDANNIVQTGGTRIILTEFFNSKINEKDYENTPTKTKQDSLRGKLLLVDKQNLLNGIFHKNGLIPQDKKIIDNENDVISFYPQITFYDTSQVVTASAFKTDDLTKINLACYLEPLNSADISKGTNSLQIYGDDHIANTLKGLEILELSGKDQKTDISFHQGISAKISNLMNGYIKNGGFIDSSLKMEDYNKKDAKLQLTRAQDRYDQKMKQSQRNYAKILDSKRQLKNFEMLTEQLNARNEL